MAVGNLIAISLVGLLGLAAAELVPRAAFTRVANYGDNPSNTSMYLYVPKNLGPNPAVIVGIHWCHGSAADYYAGTRFAAMSEQYGYIVIYPESPYLSVDGCWDISSKAALTHGGGGDSNSIANMVDLVLNEYGADASRVYVSGISSGAMMTNVMVGAYPELFAAGSVYSGVPAGCFYSANDIPDYWNSTCATGGSVATQAYWANFVKNMYPGYNGPRPKLRIHHGTADDVLNVTNYYETIKQWTGIFDYSTNPIKTLPNNPYSPYTTYIFGDMLQGILGNGVTHNIDHDEVEDLKWFGIYSQASTTTSAPSTTTAAPSTTPASPATTTTTSSGALQTHWGQCGGSGYTGPTNCESPYTCQYYNYWYSQCI